MHNSMCCYWFLGCVRFAQFSKSTNSKFLYSSLMDWSGHNGTICFAICFWIFHVSVMALVDRKGYRNNFSFFRFLVCLCCENGTYACRAAMVPIHASFGLVTFMLACATCLTGLTQKAIWKLGYVHSYTAEKYCPLSGFP